MSGTHLTLLAIGCVLAGAVVPRLGLDLVAVVALCLLVLGGVLSPEQASHGFGNTTLLTVAAMFVLAEGLQRTGAASGIGRLVEATAARGQRTLLIALLPIVMVLSGVMSNTGVVVLLLPIVVAAAQRAKTSPSRLLLPLSYASITGGTLTIVGTTTTLLVDGMVRQSGLPGLGLLQIFPIGAAFCVVTLAYLVVVGPRLLPNRTGLVVPVTAQSTRQYLTEVVLGAGSRLVGQPLGRLLKGGGRMRFLQLVRDEEIHWPPFDDEILCEDDVLLVKGTPEELIPLLRDRGVLGPQDRLGDGSVIGHDVALAEVMVAPGSRIEDMTVTEARFRHRYGVVVMAVMRRGAHLREHLGSLSLRVGDILLIQGEPEALTRLRHAAHDLIMLGGVTEAAPSRQRKAPLAIAICGTALVLAALQVMPLMVAVLAAALLLVATGCLTSAQAYRSLNLRILLILGCMLGLGLAANETGLAADVAHALVAFGDAWGERGVLLMIYLATAILTELVTNAGTAGIMVPIALAAAREGQASHLPYVMAVAMAASCSFLTPIGYQTNLLVYGPGGYRLGDYLRLGLPLVIVLAALGTWLLPIIYPFHP